MTTVFLVIKSISTTAKFEKRKRVTHVANMLRTDLLVATHDEYHKDGPE